MTRVELQALLSKYAMDVELGTDTGGEEEEKLILDTFDELNKRHKPGTACYEWMLQYCIEEGK